MSKELKTMKRARELVAEFRETGNLSKLVEEVSELSWHFGRYCWYNRALFVKSLVKELKEVKE